MDSPPIHPAAELLPMMTDKELDSLVGSILREGQKEPIERMNGVVIDGRNRLEACRRAGVLPTFKEVGPIDDVIAYVIAKNLERRHLNVSQRAMIAVKARRLYAEQAKERQRQLAGTRPNTNPDLSANLREGECGKSSDQAAKDIGIAGRSVDFAKAVVEEGSESLQSMVHRGEVAVSAAALVAKHHSQDEQTALAAAGPEAVKKEAAAIRLQQRRDAEPASEPDPAPAVAPGGNLFDDDPLPAPLSALTERAPDLPQEPARGESPAPAPKKPPLTVADLINRPSPVESYRLHSVQVHGSNADEAARTLVDALGVEYAYAVGLKLVAIGEAS